MTDMTAPIYQAADLVSFADKLFQHVGINSERSAIIANLLVEGDLLGHDTHGLQLAGPYLDAAMKGKMAVSGDPEIIADRGAVVTWNGKKLPGVWLTASALDLGIERARHHGSATVVIRQSHHIACLAAYLTRATEQGMMAIIACSDPSEHSVAPFGGKRSVFTPDPIAIGFPAGEDPILIDISASITTNGMTGRLKGEGKRFPADWVLDADGNPSDDPAVVLADPPGSILPIGGIDYGHKGFGLALMIEAMTQGLGGYGRADGETDWGASVFIQVFDPGAFGGRDGFVKQMSWIANTCRATPPRPGHDAVRMPGDRALARKRQALANGLELHGGIMESLLSFAEKFGVTPPKEL
ncbi:MAG: Ldh family oxidoreductase [Geminicoccales bacterium]